MKQQQMKSCVKDSDVKYQRRVRTSGGKKKKGRNRTETLGRGRKVTEEVCVLNTVD